MAEAAKAAQAWLEETGVAAAGEFPKQRLSASFSF